MVGEEVARGGMLPCWLRSGCWSWPMCHHREFCCPPSSWSCSLLLSVCLTHTHTWICVWAPFSLAAAVGELWMCFWKSPKAQIFPARRSLILQVEAPQLRNVPIMTEEKPSFSLVCWCTGTFMAVPASEGSLSKPRAQGSCMGRIFLLCTSHTWQFTACFLAMSRAASLRRMENLSKCCHFKKKLGEFPCS